MVGELVRFKREVIRVNYGPPGDPEPDFRYETVMKVVVVRDGLNLVMSVSYLVMLLLVLRRLIAFMANLLKYWSFMTTKKKGV